MRQPAPRRVRAGQRGASSVEYALIATLIAIVVLGSVSLFGSSTAQLFHRSCASLPAQSSAC